MAATIGGQTGHSCQHHEPLEKLWKYQTFSVWLAVKKKRKTLILF